MAVSCYIIYDVIPFDKIPTEYVYVVQIQKTPNAPPHLLIGIKDNLFHLKVNGVRLYDSWEHLIEIIENKKTAIFIFTTTIPISNITIANLLAIFNPYDRVSATHSCFAPIKDFLKTHYLIPSCTYWYECLDYLYTNNFIQSTQGLFYNINTTNNIPLPTYDKESIQNTINKRLNRE